MAEAKVLSGAGLRGQVAGQTELCTVGKTGAGLTYRGYDVRELAAGAIFEEVAYLLLYGELPNQVQRDPRRPLAQRRPFRRRLLHAVFAKHALACIQCRANFVGIKCFRHGHERHRAMIAARFFLGICNGCLDLVQVRNNI